MSARPFAFGTEQEAAVMFDATALRQGLQSATAEMFAAMPADLRDANLLAAMFQACIHSFDRIQNASVVDGFSIAFGGLLQQELSADTWTLAVAHMGARAIETAEMTHRMMTPTTGMQ